MARKSPGRTREINDDFSSRVFKQHSGGKGNFDGIAFQVFASAVYVARFAVLACRGKIDDLYLRAEAPDSRVEDLHAVSDLGPRWHFQMKASDRSSWDEKLIEQFKDDHANYRVARLVLVTSSRDRARRMWRARDLAEVPFAFVDWVDFEYADLAHRTREIRRLLDELAPVPNCEDSYYSGWKNIVGAWTMASRGRVSTLLYNASIGSKYSVRQLQEPSAEVAEHLRGLTTVELNLKVSKGMLVISDGVISMVVPLLDEQGENLRDWDALEFENPWQLFEVLGSFKSDQ